MFWNVTFIYNAFIRTTDHCKVQTAFVSLFYSFINMKRWNASNSSVVVGRPRPLGHLTNFFTNFYELFNFGKFVKIRDFFAEVTNSRSMVLSMDLCIRVNTEVHRPWLVEDICLHMWSVLRDACSMQAACRMQAACLVSRDIYSVCGLLRAVIMNKSMTLCRRIALLTNLRTNSLAAFAPLAFNYTVNHKKRDILFLTITSANLNWFL